MSKKVLNILKTLLISYAVTIIMLLIISLCLYKFNMSNWQITTAILVTYVFSSFAGGYIIARKQKNRRLFWGLAVGVTYLKYSYIFYIWHCVFDFKSFCNAFLYTIKSANKNKK